jgi:hypothetical protein
MRKRVYAYLIYLILITLLVTAVSFSRYATLVTGSEEAGVAGMVIEYVPVSATLNGDTVSSISNGIMVNNVTPGTVLVYHFNIRNYEGSNLNQVLMKYHITVSFDPDPKEIPLTYDLAPGGTYNSAGGGWTYLGFEEQETHSYTLTVTWEESENDPSYASKTQQVLIEIDSEQVDSIP